MLYHVYTSGYPQCKVQVHDQYFASMIECFLLSLNLVRPPPPPQTLQAPLMLPVHESVVNTKVELAGS